MTDNDKLKIIDKRLSFVENAALRHYRSIIKDADDDLSTDGNRIEIRFSAKTECEVLISFAANFSTDCRIDGYLNGIKMSAYKSIIGQKEVHFKGVGNCGENTLEFILTDKAIIGRDYSVKVSGFVDDSEDTSYLSVIKVSGNTYVMFFDSVKSRAVLYVVEGYDLVALKEWSGVSSATVTDYGEKSVLIATTDHASGLTVRVYDTLSGEVSDDVNLVPDVKKVTGYHIQGTSGLLALSDGQVYKIEVSADLSFSLSRLTSAAVMDVYSSPQVAGQFVITSHNGENLLLSEE